jgi:large subunit ribosomal protein L25
MRTSFVIGADRREMQGKGASRRLRHTGKVPAILYGGHKDPEPLILDQQNLLTMIASEKFYSTIVQLKIEDKLHEAIRIHLPIHFRNENASPGVKLQGGIVSHMLTDVEVSCLPKDLPEYLEVDLAMMNLNETKFLADIPLPAGIVLTDLVHGKNRPVVSIHAPRAEEPEAAPAEAAAAPVEGAAATTPAAPGAAGAAPAAGGEAKKEDKKEAAAPAKKEGGKK